MSSINALFTGISSANSKDIGLITSDDSAELDQNALGFAAIFNSLANQLLEDDSEFEKASDQSLSNGFLSESELFAAKERFFSLGLGEKVLGDIQADTTQGIKILENDIEKENNTSELLGNISLKEQATIPNPTFISSNQKNMVGAALADSFLENQQLDNGPKDGSGRTTTQAPEQTPHRGICPAPKDGSGRTTTQAPQVDLNNAKNSITELLQNLRGEIKDTSKMDQMVIDRNVTDDLLGSQKVNIEIQRMNRGVFTNLDGEMPSEQNIPQGNNTDNIKLSTNAHLDSEQQIMTTAQGNDFLEDNNANSQQKSGHGTFQDAFLDKFGMVNQVQGTSNDFSNLINKTENHGSIGEQIANNIFEKAYRMRPQVKELDIQLHPQELGKIRISLSWEDGRVSLRMIASEQGTGQFLQSNMAELKDSLSQLGIQCGNMEMGLDQQHHSSEQQENEPTSHNLDEEQEEIIDVAELMDSEDGEINLEQGTTSTTINVEA